MANKNAHCWSSGNLFRPERSHLVRLSKQLVLQRGCEGWKVPSGRYVRELVGMAAGRMIRDLRVAVRRYGYQHLSDLNLISTSVSQHRAIMRTIVKRDLPTLLSGIEANYLFGMQILRAGRELAEQ